ncbi:MAG: response regulator transcription factor [Actinobacteria bacterium]|nr:MAG: response regulator transcription factor [Actinomycetota bacterium]
MKHRSEQLPIRVVLCDDVPEFRALIRFAIDDDPSLEVVAEADSGDAAVERVASAQADVVLLDLILPGRSGLEAIPLVRARAPECAIVVLSRFPDQESKAREAGADLFVEKGTPLAGIRAAIHSAAQGQR